MSFSFLENNVEDFQCETVDEVRDTLQPLSSSSKSLVLWRCKTNHDIMQSKYSYSSNQNTHTHQIKILIVYR